MGRIIECLTCWCGSKWRTLPIGSGFSIPTPRQQRQSGLRLDKVLRNLDDPNEVVTWFEVTDLAKARGFVTSPAVPRAQEDSGVVDKPDIYFLA